MKFSRKNNEDKKNKRVKMPIMFYSLFPFILTTILYFRDETNYIYRILFMFALIAVMICMVIDGLVILVEKTEESTSREAENIRRFIKS
jgi:hypothetical protein